MTAMIDITNAKKTFTMHLQGCIELPVVHGVSFHIVSGECVVLSGPSGAGKSSILKMIFGNYRCDGGRIGIRHEGSVIDLAATPSAMSASFCARCRGWRRSTWWPSR
jgi:alpha-D-ribose 1-methylphosphonate 5-triphosphate synthase subunit PhnL